ncbi:MAG: DUF5615 family PIN-like protein [Chloroflexia bacterium]
MRILLDECLPRLLKNDITGHDVATVTQVGWSGISNGQLLSRAEGQFDVLLTVDCGIEYQQNIRGRQIALIVLDAPNKLPALRLLIPGLLETLATIQPGEVAHIAS